MVSSIINERSNNNKKLLITTWTLYKNWLNKKSKIDFVVYSKAAAETMIQSDTPNIANCWQNRLQIAS